MRLYYIKKPLLLVLGLGSVLVLAYILTSWNTFVPESPEVPAEQVTSVVLDDANGATPNDEPNSGGPTDAVTSGVDDYIGDDYYVEYRLERERSRGRQVELLHSIINDLNASPEARQGAQQRLLEITLKMDREVSVENILRAKGLNDVVVFFQDDDTVTVVVPALTTPEQGTTVINLVARATSIVPEKIMVIAREIGK
ncbi:MAG: SpoIIIAH-like family protein [Clostridia bacterium]|nr:SpoIIIAH-like family protein [Clostridia bacterium]MDQ7790547.1 SpoIIIAH-like family protein [Clostridia bacterium]